MHLAYRREYLTQDFRVSFALLVALSTTEICCLEANIRAPGYCEVCHQASQLVMEMMCIFIWCYLPFGHAFVL